MVYQLTEMNPHNMTLNELKGKIPIRDIRRLLREASDSRNKFSYTEEVTIVNDKQLGAYLREARTGAGLSMRQLGSLIGVSAAYLCDVERGFRGISTTNHILYLWFCEKYNSVN